MKKIIVVLFLLISTLGFCQDFTKFGFGRWAELTVDENLIWMEGFMLGVYYASLLASQKYTLPREDAISIMILDQTPAGVLAETCGWYRRTEKWLTPLYIAIYRRNLDY